jgi:hypothetical protein
MHLKMENFFPRVYIYKNIKNTPTLSIYLSNIIIIIDIHQNIYYRVQYRIRRRRRRRHAHWPPPQTRP